MGVILPVLPPALELALQILMMGYVESEVACFEAENSKGMSRTGGLVELPSFFEGKQKSCPAFQKMCLVSGKASAELQARDAGLQLLGRVRARS